MKRPNYFFMFLGLIVLTLNQGILNCFAQAPNWLWAKNAGGNKSEEAYSIAADISGNIIMTGGFSSSSITFGKTTLKNIGITDMFIAKYDKEGNVLWAKSAGGNDYDIAYSVTTDALGNIFVAGRFSSSSITFGSFTLKNAGITDMFIVKYDNTGNVVWVKNAGGEYGDFARAITADVSGNIYVAGKFSSPTISFGYIALTNANASGSSDMFIVKYNTNGDVIWAKNAGDNSNDEVKTIASDAYGNIYVAGKFQGAITFESILLINENKATSDMFIVKYNPNGKVIWAKSAGGNSHDEVNSITTDASGNVFIVGNFGGASITFDSYTLNNSPYSDDMFIVKYDAHGDVIWAKSAGGNNNDKASSVIADVSGNIYVAGYFHNSSSISNSAALIDASDNANTFLIKYDANGNVVLVKSAGGAVNENFASSVTIDASGNIYMAGWFNASVTFGSTILTTTSSGFPDIFLVKIGNIPCSLQLNTTTTAICSNSKLGTATVKASGGKVPYTYLWNTSPTQTSITATNLDTGSYTIIVTDNAGCKNSATVTISAHPLPDIPVITQQADTLISSVANSYQWLINAQSISGATFQTFIPKDSGYYIVMITDVNGCSSTSARFMMWK